MTGSGIAAHATALVLGESGIVIRGPSGVGKSRLAYLLLSEAGRYGCFCRLIGDDCVILHAYGSAVIVSAHPAIEGLLERRTQPIARIPREKRAVVRLVVDLQPPSVPLPRFPEEGAHTVVLVGARDLPLLRLQAPPDAVSCQLVLEALGTRLKAVDEN